MWVAPHWLFQDPHFRQHWIKRCRRSSPQHKAAFCVVLWSKLTKHASRSTTGWSCAKWCPKQRSRPCMWSYRARDPYSWDLDIYPPKPLDLLVLPNKCDNIRSSYPISLRTSAGADRYRPKACERFQAFFGGFTSVSLKDASKAHLIDTLVPNSITLHYIWHPAAKWKTTRICWSAEHYRTLLKKEQTP